MIGDVRPLPRITAVNRPYWEAAKKHEIRYPKCTSCGAWVYPIASMCQTCWGENLEWKTLSGRGTVSSWVVVHRAMHPAFEREVPYIIGEVDLEEGIRVIGKLKINKADLRASLPVRAEFEDLPEISLLQFVA